MSEVLSYSDGPRILELPDIEPLRPDFLHADVSEIFDWPDILQRVSEAYGWNPTEGHNAYLVVFRSLRSADADADLLKMLDDRAYEEAQTSNGLLLYHKGALGPNGECVSFCLWVSREAALEAVQSQNHVAAANVVGQMYEKYRLDRFNLIWQDGIVTLDKFQR